MEEIPLEILIGAVILMIGALSFGIQMQIRRNREQSKRQFETLKEVSPENEHLRERAQQERQLHQESVAQAIQEHPELAASEDPESLSALAAIIAGIERDKKLLTEISIAKQSQERAELQEQRTKELQDQQAELEAQRVETLAARSPLQRLISQDLGLTTASILIIVLSVIAVALIFVLSRS